MHPRRQTGNGWRAAAGLHRSEPVEGAKTNGTNWRSLMKPHAAEQHRRVRNPFDVMDVPDPNDQEVQEFATGSMLAGTSDDDNAKSWTAATDQHGAIEGIWSCRWNGGADPTIPGDAPNKWKQ